MTAKFSARTNWDLQRTKYAEALEKLHANSGPLSSGPIFDLTASNLTTSGFEYDSAQILSALNNLKSLEYEPDPRGLLAARRAVAQYYAETAGTPVEAERIFLTTSTSEAYSYLFRLHCDPGSEVLIARPSYPLFEFLADLDDVRLVQYPLFYDHGWHCDLAELQARITSRTRAIVVVHPNNPTGHFTAPEERKVLERICEQHRLALIVDEVFLDYSLETEGASARASFVSGDHPVLTYVLSGLSKVAGLPQMKAAWLAMFGPEPLLGTATGRLEVIADTFLSMNAPVQHALPHLLALRRGIQQQVLARLRSNLAALDARLRNSPAFSRLEIQAGWYAMLRVPALRGGEELAIRLMEQARTVVHPGYFYGMEGDGWIVVSLLAPSEEFTEGIDRLIRFFT